MSNAGMSIAELLSIIGVCVIGLGLIVTWVRNGRDAAGKSSSLKTALQLDINNINDKLEDRMTGLKAIKKSVDDQRLHCTKVSTLLEEKVSTNQKNIEDLKKKVER